MTELERILYDSAASLGASTESLTSKMAPSEKRLVAAITGATSQAILSKLGEAFGAYLAEVSAGETRESMATAIQNILQPPKPPTGKGNERANVQNKDVIDKMREQRTAAAQHYAGEEADLDRPSVSPPYTRPEAAPMPPTANPR